MKEESLALHLSPALSARLHLLARAAALPVDDFVAKTLEATVGLGVTTDVATVARPAAVATTNHQEPVVVIFRRLAQEAQLRMDTLMDRHNEGALSPIEEAELAALVAEYEQIMLMNSEQLLRMQQPLNAMAAV